MDATVMDACGSQLGRRCRYPAFTILCPGLDTGFPTAPDPDQRGQLVAAVPVPL